MTVEWEQMLAVDFVCPCTEFELRFCLDRNDQIVKIYRKMRYPPERIFHFLGSRDIMLHPGQPVALMGKVPMVRNTGGFQLEANIYYVIYEDKYYLSIDQCQISETCLEDLRRGQPRAKEEHTRFWGQATYEELKKLGTVYIASRPLTKEEFDEELRTRLARGEETDVSSVPEGGP